MTLEIEKASHNMLKAKPTDAKSLSFGSVLTDHMFTMKYSDGKWHNPRIEPYHPLSIDPSALVLHYGQGIFEGMKAYRRGDKVYLFRPEKNMERMNVSAQRMVMPEFDGDFVLECLKQLLRIEADWIPQEKGTSLYIRPTMIATEPKLGVRPSKEYLFFIILSPVGPYFKEGFNPISVKVSQKYIRAARGGVGHAKTMGNYAASLFGAVEASNEGFSQVLWLDAVERKYIEESGTMNVFIRFEDEIVTPPLNGTILPGITRLTVIQLLKEWGYEVHERDVSIQEVIEGMESRNVLEVFGTGTAAIIAPIGILGYDGKKYQVADGETGELSRKLFDEIIGIQRGEIKDPYGWVVVV